MRLEATDIRFGYKNSRPVLDNVSISLKAGERVAIVGPSGCGKSTLSKILAGYLTPWSGRVLLDGHPLPPKGFCPVQFIHQHPEKAVNPRWKLGKTLYESWIPDKSILDEMGISPKWMGRYPYELSGGEIQRFCIARAMAPQTKYIIADEISTMLDVITQAQIWQLMLESVRKRGMGLITVTHSPELAKMVSERIIYM